MNPLDRPFWQAFSTLQSDVSLGTDRARRYQPEIGPFAACRDDDDASLADLARLVATTGSVALLQAGVAPVPPGCKVHLQAEGVQMVASNLDRLPYPGDLLGLGETDVIDMQALAGLTEPGPFASKTSTLGRFYGVRLDGRLVAMAGTRLHLPGFREVSAVCTHPDARGRGLAARLCARVCADIVAAGETPFLHAFASNHSAIRLYERLGFSLSRTVTLTVLAPSDGD